MNEIWVLARTGYGRTIVLGAVATWSELLDILHEHGLEELLERPPRLHSDQHYGSIEIGPFTYVVERVTLRGKPSPAEPTRHCSVASRTTAGCGGQFAIMTGRLGERVD